MKYIFILGRNIALSIQEVLAYFEKVNNEILNYSVVNNAMVVEVEKQLKPKAIDSFGGVIAIGEVFVEGEIQNIMTKLDARALYYGTKNNFNYCVWNFSNEESYNKLLEYLKNRFKQEKLKAGKKNFSDEIKLQSGEIAYNLSSKLIDEEYFLFKEKDNFVFGRIFEKCNYNILEKRDMEKPIRREELSISPRLAKIMINLSKVKYGEKIIDCFCGIGVILQEALLQDIKVIGIDNDKKAIGGARQNLEWAKFNNQNYQLIRKDSGKIKIQKVSALVTEPDFGKTLKKTQTPETAKKQINEFEKLIIDVLNNLKENISGRIVFTSPSIKTMKKRISADIKNIAEKTRLKIIKGFPIPEFRENQIVGREIVVLER